MTISAKKISSLRSTIIELLNNATPEKGILHGSRRFIRGKPGKCIVFFSSEKMRAVMPCESKLEADSCLELEMNNSVRAYITQPITIRYLHNKRYTPDAAYLNAYGDIVLREVKQSGQLQKESLLETLYQTKRYLNRNGLIFEVVTEKQLHMEPFHYNRKYLHRYSSSPLTDIILDLIKSKIPSKNNKTSLAQLRDLCKKQGFQHHYADTLLQRGMVNYDPSLKINSKTLIWK